jgi:hypothetical protein
VTYRLQCGPVSPSRLHAIGDQTAWYYKAAWCRPLTSTLWSVGPSSPLLVNNLQVHVRAGTRE